MFHIQTQFLPGYQSCHSVDYCHALTLDPYVSFHFVTDNHYSNPSSHVLPSAHIKPSAHFKPNITDNKNTLSPFPLQVLPSTFRCISVLSSRLFKRCFHYALKCQLILMLPRHILLHRQFIFSLTPMMPLIFFHLSLCRSYILPFAIYMMLSLHTIIIRITLLTNGLRIFSLSFSYFYRHDLSTFCPIGWLSVTTHATVKRVFPPSTCFLGFLCFSLFLSISHYNLFCCSVFGVTVQVQNEKWYFTNTRTTLELIRKIKRLV